MCVFSMLQLSKDIFHRGGVKLSMTQYDAHVYLFILILHHFSTLFTKYMQ